MLGRLCQIKRGSPIQGYEKLYFEKINFYFPFFKIFSLIHLLKVFFRASNKGSNLKADEKENKIKIILLF